MRKVDCLFYFHPSNKSGKILLKSGKILTASWQVQAVKVSLKINSIPKTMEMLSQEMKSKD